MPRPLRLCPVGYPQHIIQRGNNRQACFTSDKDKAAYAHWLHESAMKFDVSIHAWAFMTNHVHLLVTPNRDLAISSMIQKLGRHYVPYFNFHHSRTGTLWEGRFKSCLVQADTYFLLCQRYIELNPVRAGMVNHPADHFWSSYHVNALGKGSILHTPHPSYLALGKSKQERRERYRSLFEKNLSKKELKTIRRATNSCLVLGSEDFKDSLISKYNLKVRLKKTGPVKKGSSD